jgi:hypothetical protein
MFWEDFGIPALVVFAVILGIGAIISAPALMLAYAACASQASKMELDHSWGPLQDCMVKVDGKWMPLDSYKVVKLRVNG